MLVVNGNRICFMTKVTSSLTLHVIQPLESLIDECKLLYSQKIYYLEQCLRLML